jgi:3-oxoacyl-[acyl-carrier protein] reductase
VNILVNNAGTILYKRVEEVTEKEFDNIVACNVKGLFFVCQQAAKKMADGGKIISRSSSVTKLMMPTNGPYAQRKNCQRG